MADFYQTGIVTTIHRLGTRSPETLEADLVEFTRHRSIALVLPCLFEELERPALARILDQLSSVKYIHQVVLSLGRANDNEFEHAQEYFSRSPLRIKILWNDGPRIQALYKTLEESGLRVGEDGKGRSCWMAYGYVLATEESDVIALHDCDVVTYDKQMLARLVYPLISPHLDFKFCKAYYARVTDRLHGRVTRLLISPLIRSLIRIVGYHDFLGFLDSFRYPLAGEFAMKADLARVTRIPNDWGLEVGMLAEVYRNTATKRVCQVDVADKYDHKHQSLSPDNPEAGLMRMAVDISKTLFRTMAAEGIELSRGLLNSLLATYVRTAEDTLIRYHADAVVNGLNFDRHEEEVAVDVFARAVKIAADQFTEDPLGAPQLPNWTRINSALPDFLEHLLEAVEKDNARTEIGRAR